MKHHMIEQLMQSGLSHKEALVYHASLVLGPSTILRISREAGTQRPTTYAIIEQLIRRGLMRREEIGLKKRFVAENPENLRRVMEQKMQNVSQIIPDLTTLFKKSGREHTVRVYEGLSALRTISAEIARTTHIGDIRYFIGGSVGWKEVDPQWHEQYLKWRSRTRLDAKLLFQDSERAKLHQSLSRTIGQQVRILPPGTLLQSDILITPRHVVIARMTHPQTAIMIEDQDIVDTYITLFNLLWNTTI
ncbi:TrmB family transcriptional regulator [Candidatus Kaiserbacteria bacterium]|nr:TrmB family transcriptional regulator [Candidatus Kaiserbacteria bacterium]